MPSNAYKRLIDALLVATLVAAPLPARAEDPLPQWVRLVYERGPGTEPCPTDAHLKDAVRGNVGRHLFSESAPDVLTVRVARTAGSGKFLADLELRDAGGRVAWTQPTMSSRNCVILLADVAMAITVHLDPIAVKPPPPPVSVVTPEKPEPEPAPALPPPAPAPPPPDPKPSREAPPPATRPPVVLGADVGAAFGMLPATAFRATAYAGMRWESASFSLEGHVLPRVHAPSGSQEQVSIWSVGGAVVPCYHRAIVRWLSGAGCAVIMFEAAQVRGIGFDWDRFLASWGVGGRLGVETRLGERFGLRAYGEVLGVPVPLAVTGGTTVHPTPIWTGGFVAGAIGAGGMVAF